MLIVETIRKIRLAIHRDGKSIRKTAKELRVSRNTVRKVVRCQPTSNFAPFWSLKNAPPFVHDCSSSGSRMSPALTFSLSR
jgi:hypothetical protein